MCDIRLKLMRSVVMRGCLFGSTQYLQQLSYLQVQPEIPGFQFKRLQHRLVRRVVLPLPDER